MNKQHLRSIIREQIEMVQMEKELTLTVETINIMKKQVDSHILSENDKKQQLNESVLLSILSIIISVPKIIQFLGSAVKWVVNFFKKTFGANTKKENIGDSILSVGNKLEGFYIKTIKTLLKVTGVAKKAGLKTDADLNKAATVIFYSMLFAAAITAGYASIESITNMLTGKVAVSSAVNVATTIAKGSSDTITAGTRTIELLNSVGVAPSDVLSTLNQLKGKVF